MPARPLHLRLALDRLDVATRAEHHVREVAVLLVAVLLVGLGALQSGTTLVVAPSASGGRVLTAADADEVRAARDVRQPRVTPTSPRTAPVRPTAPRVATSRQAAARKVAPPRPRTPWLPTGTGMWLHEWEASEGGDPRAVVTRAKASGLSHLYVQTGSSRKGWLGTEVLSELLPVAGPAGIDVIAWDFPKLNDPEGDARRLVRAATFRAGGARVKAVAPDVETSAEGTNLKVDSVGRYYRELLRLLPRDVAVLATVPWPSEKRTTRYPYRATAPFADAFVPMAYWYNRDPGLVTRTSMTFLRQFGKPVMPVGQGYDGRVDAPYLPVDPDPGGSVQAFVDAAREGGARSISLWSWQTTGPLQWATLTRAGAQFRR